MSYDFLTTSSEMQAQQGVTLLTQTKMPLRKELPKAAQYGF